MPHEVYQGCLEMDSFSLNHVENCPFYVRPKEILKTRITVSFGKDAQHDFHTPPDTSFGQIPYMMITRIWENKNGEVVHGEVLFTAEKREDMKASYEFEELNSTTH